MKRVLFVAHDSADHVGGVGTWLCTLLPMLRERGIACAAALFLSGGEGFVSRRLRESGIEVFTHPQRRWFRHRVEWLTELIVRTQSTVLVPNYLVSGFAAAAALREQGVRCIAVLHSDDAFYQALVDCQCRGDPVVRFDRAVAVSRFIEHGVRMKLTGDFPLARIPCGIDLRSGRAAVPDRRLRLVYVGRLVQYQKRISDVVAGLCRAVQEVPGTTADIIGDGDGRALAESAAAAAGHPPEVRFLGAMAPDEVRRLLPSYHVQVLLSDYEGLPVALLEGMAAGLVPVCTRMRSGIDELVADGESGILVDDRGDALVAAIRRLQESNPLWEKLSAGAQAAVLPFGADRCTDQWVDLLERSARSSGDHKPMRRPHRIGLPQWRPEFQWDMQRGVEFPGRLKRWQGSLRARIARYRGKLMG